MTDLTHAQEQWTQTLNHLSTSLNRGTFEAWVKDTRLVGADNDQYIIAAASSFAVEWLEGRLHGTIGRALKQVTGQEIELKFTVADIAPAAVPEEVQAVGPDQVVAEADYYAGHYEKDGAGFSQVSHYITYFYMPLLGGAFALWKFLESVESANKRPLKTATGWTAPVHFKMATLAQKLGKAHHRYIAGDEIECVKSRDRRKAGQPLRSPADCCHSPRHELLRFKDHPKAGCGLMCMHWQVGLLQTLDQHGLVTVEFKNLDNYSFSVQIWRILPVLTPRQYRQLPTAELRKDHDEWIESYGHLFNIPNLKFWQSLTAPSLPPLMPTYTERSHAHNLDQRRRWQNFLRHARPNPYFIAGIAEEEGD